jgi:hypothetical protein
MLPTINKTIKTYKELCKISWHIPSWYWYLKKKSLEKTAYKFNLK